MIHKEMKMIPNGNFQVGEVGFLPYGWEIASPYLALKPLFELASVHDSKMMLARGNGNENCIGYVRTMLQMNGGQTYRMRVRFRMSDGLDPNKNLLFACYAKTASGVGYSYNDGIFKFSSRDNI